MYSIHYVFCAILIVTLYMIFFIYCIFLHYFHNKSHTINTNYARTGLKNK